MRPTDGCDHRGGPTPPSAGCPFARAAGCPLSAPPGQTSCPASCPTPCPTKCPMPSSPPAPSPSPSPSCGPEEALRLIGIGFVGAIAAVSFDVGSALATGTSFDVPNAIIDFLQGFFGGVLSEILVTRFSLDRTLAIIIAAFISGIINALTTPQEAEPVPFPPVSAVQAECPFLACPFLSGRP